MTTNSVGIVVTVYERTLRKVTEIGYFDRLKRSQCFDFDEVVLLVNNVNNPLEAREVATQLKKRGEISSFSFVQDLLPEAISRFRISERIRARRPYLFDFGLTMPLTIQSKWLLGWDVEARVLTPRNWIDESIDLMNSDRRIFHVSLNWPKLDAKDPGLDGEVVEWKGKYGLNWGFSDQVFLLQRSSLMRPIYNSFSPRAVVRHAPHPYTFEYRVEAFQRSSGLLRATLKDHHYYFDKEEIPGVIERTGQTKMDLITLHSLRRFEHHVLDRLPRNLGPKYIANASSDFAQPKGD